MRISEIVELLSAKYCDLKNYIDEEKMIVSVEKFTHYHQDTNHNTLFITTDEIINSIERDLSDTSFIIIKSQENLDEKRKYNSIFISENITIKDVYDDVRDILEQNNAINAIISDLYSCLEKVDFLEPLIDKAFNYLQNPLIIYDYLHNIKAFRKNGPIENKLWTKDIELGHLDFDNFHEESYLCLEKLIAVGETEYKLINNMCRVYAIKHNKKLLGFIAILEYYRPFKDLDAKILKVVADIIAVKSFNDNLIIHEDRFIYSHLMRNILDNKIKTSQDLKGLLKTRNWKQKKMNRILLFQDKDNNTLNYLNFLKSRVSKVSHEFKILYYESYVVILEEFNNESEEQVHKVIIEQFRESNLYVGISDIFYNLINIRKYYEQAKKALMFNEVLDCNNTINYYSDFILADFFKACYDNLDYEEYYHPFIIFLEEYDKRNNSELANTLFVYLSNNRSVLKSSAKMNVHKNTINYRINKIKELVDSDLENLSDNFHILLSYKIKDIASKIESRA